MRDQGDQVEELLTSPDGLVRVAIDSVGAFARLELAPQAFEHTRPDTLARTITELIQRGTAKTQPETPDWQSPPPRRARRARPAADT